MDLEPRVGGEQGGARSWLASRYGRNLSIPMVSHLGPIVGTRTWGGLIGYSGNPQLVDGGLVIVPTFRIYGDDGTWFAEGHGVDPDIDVPEDVTALAEGRDPQIERGVQELLRTLKEHPVVAPDRPAPEDRSRPRGGGGSGGGVEGEARSRGGAAPKGPGAGSGRRE